MKIKGDFITNSSSTNFFFIFKGNLYKQLLEHSDAFDVTFISYDNSIFRANVHEIIQAIKDLRKVEKWDRKSSWQYDVKVEKLSEIEKDIKEEIGYIEKEIKENAQKKIGSYSWKYHYLAELKDQLRLVKDARSRKFRRFLRIGFGDNDGDVCAGNLGTAMDYEGRKIKIDDEKLIVFTQQNR